MLCRCAERDRTESAVGGGLRLQLLGEFALARGSQQVALPPAAQRLLAFLALHGPASRPVIMGTLWPNVGERHARGSLRTTIWRLNQDGQRLVGPAGDALALRLDIAVDIRMFADSAQCILHGSLPPAAGCAPLLLGGELLPSWYHDWVIFERERLRQLRLHALDAMASRLAADGLYADALQAAIESVRLEPLRESAHRAVIAIHLAEGNMAEALRHYGLFRRLLEAELGVEPSPRLAGMLPPQRRVDSTLRPATVTDAW